MGLFLPHTPRSAAAQPEPSRSPGTTRHASDRKCEDAHRNSTYSGSLLHNNRHLTQGSPDFTDSKKGRGGEKRARERAVRGMGETEPDQH